MTQRSIVNSALWKPKNRIVYTRTDIEFLAANKSGFITRGDALILDEKRSSGIRFVRSRFSGKGSFFLASDGTVVALSRCFALSH